MASVVHGDLRDAISLLADPGIKGILDPGRPIAVLLVAVLHFIRDQEEPARIVETLRHAMPSGSYFVISHGTQDFNPAQATAAVRGYDEATAPFVLRSREVVERFFDGLDMVDLGSSSCRSGDRRVISSATRRNMAVCQRRPQEVALQQRVETSALLEVPEGRAGTVTGGGPWKCFLMICERNASSMASKELGSVLSTSNTAIRLPASS